LSVTISLVANTIGYPVGGGHYWVRLSWAFGFRALGCRVIWLGEELPRWERERSAKEMAGTQKWLAPFVHEAATHMDQVASNHELDSCLARQRQKGYFCARKMARRVLEATF
jgi:hypothetical protein